MFPPLLSLVATNNIPYEHLSSINTVCYKKHNVFVRLKSHVPCPLQRRNMKAIAPGCRERKIHFQICLYTLKGKYFVKGVFNGKKEHYGR